MKALLPATRGALLTIVPHDVLSNLSFAALQDTSGRYLLEDYTLHYAPAGALFQFTAARRRPQPRSGAMLMVSDPDPVRRSTLDPALPRLPGARHEAAAITRQLAGGPGAVAERRRRDGIVSARTGAGARRSCISPPTRW